MMRKAAVFSTERGRKGDGTNTEVRGFQGRRCRPLGREWWNPRMFGTTSDDDVVGGLAEPAPRNHINAEREHHRVRSALTNADSSVEAARTGRKAGRCRRTSTARVTGVIATNINTAATIAPSAKPSSTSCG